MVRVQTSRKSNRTSLERGRRVRLNPDTFKRMVEETVIRVYGSTSIGSPRFGVKTTALHALRQAAEEFLTKMWKEVHDIAVVCNQRETVTREDFAEWRRKHICIPKKRKSTCGKTLCQLFESIKQRRHRPRLMFKKPQKLTQRNFKTLKIHLQQIYFDQMKDGMKTVEARPYYPCYAGYSEGDCILFTSPSGEEFWTEIEKISRYRNFEFMLRCETVEECLPGLTCEDLNTALNTYHNFRDNTYKELAQKYGVIAFKINLM